MRIKYQVKPFPDRLPEINNHLQTRKEYMPTYGTSLGFSAQEIADLAADTDNFAYLVSIQQVVEDSIASYAAWRRAMIWGAPEELPAAPPFVAVNTPEATLGGIVARGRAAQQRIRRAPAFTNIIGEAFGILVAYPSPPTPESFVPKVTLKALSGGHVQGKWVRSGFEAIRMEWRPAGDTIWRPAGVYTASPAILEHEADQAPAPQVREYRGVMIEKNLPVSQWSPILTVVTTP